MKLKNLIVIGGVAALAFWLLRKGNGQGRYVAGINTTAGEPIILREQDGLIVDQYGGVWV